ncbi:MAG: SH3 domain-containing protein [Paracoccaceae bacterium]|nr:SH3 domain-containing protein [Paracoccaceae bacterium]MDE2675250.1 SH3 domain-containing protein [Paracoccaceae bacterium]MDE2738410.1 SH3 domain-containing protein [Paracoccaceae bacterium]MXZ50047.1 aspartyl-trna synthetase [Paracoccaceae bacterium]MYF46674.1 aspartyl-trna synthetase [Paracoccaceae bacterium]
MKQTIKLFLLIILFFGYPVISFSQEAEPAGETKLGKETGLPIPRYVSMKATLGNARKGSNIKYAVNWVFTKPGIPFRVLDEDGGWRLVETQDGVGGWMFSSLLTGKRTVLTTSDNTPLMALPMENSRTIALAEEKVIGYILKCELDWCEIESNGFKGWVQKTNLWGVEPEEIFE